MSLAGEFNDLRKVGVTLTSDPAEASCLSLLVVWQVSPDQWKVMEALIRSTKGS